MNKVDLAEAIAISPVLSIDEKRRAFGYLTKNDTKEAKNIIFQLHASATSSSSWVSEETRTKDENETTEATRGGRASQH